MNNRTTTENGQGTSRFGSASPGQTTEGGAPPARTPDSTMGQDNAMGTNIPPEGADDERSFRRLGRGGSGSGQGGGRNRGDRNTARGASAQSWGEGGRYQQRRDNDTDQISRMENEGGGMSYARNSEYSNDVYRDRNRDQGLRGSSEGGAAQVDRSRQTEFDKNRDRSWEQSARYVDTDRGNQRDRPSEGGRSFERSNDSGRESKWWQTEAVTVTDVMTKNVKTVDPEATVSSIAELMRQEDVGVVPVVRADGRLYGLITDRDIVVRGLGGDKPIDQCRAKDLATKDLEVASTHDPLSDVIDMMGRQQIRRVPVLDEKDRLVGIISLGDIANRADSDDELQSAFERISGRRSFWSRIWR